MRQSRFFVKTLKSVPKDASAKNHELLLRGGFIYQVAAGRYAFLPLGFRVWQRIIEVIDRHMTELGSERIVTPTLHPIEIWKQTNRDKAFGDEMMIVEDHHGSTFAIGATAEGLMTEMMKSQKFSYKDLPVVVHQFVQKFRDEKRPRGGLLRVREFMMKDAYSFHTDEESLLEWYDKFFKAYLEIAKEFDLEAVPVLADSGAIGGEYNHEFMVESEAGEDEIVVCQKCNYAANTEKAESKVEQIEQDSELKAREDIEGKGIVGVEKLAEYLKIPVEQTTKTMLYETDEGKIVAVMMRGDYDINEVKLKNYLQTNSIKLTDAETVKKVTNAEVGYAGPIDLPDEVKVVCDLSCKDRTNFEVGANKTDYHTINANFERDFPTPEFVDVRLVKVGDKCKECNSVLEIKRAIEWGHTFHQGQFYAKPHKSTFVAQSGEEKVLWQGAYGIGIGRTMATVVETHNDENGIIWPSSIAPFDVHLVEIKADEQVKKQAEGVYQALRDLGIEVLYDDRDESPGSKFADSDLIGIPYRIVVSPKTVESGELEIKPRSKPEAYYASLAEFLKSFK